MCESLSRHYEMGDPLAALGWSWPLFCAQWARMLDALTDRELEQRRKKARQKAKAQQAELERLVMGR